VATYHVTFVTPDTQIETVAADDQYLLDVAAAAGLPLPYMCLQGWCTTCAGKILEGQVDQSEALAFCCVCAVSPFARRFRYIGENWSQPWMNGPASLWR
jgi:ferredoxin